MGVTMMPVLPFIEDSVENVVDVVDRAAASGARHGLICSMPALVAAWRPHVPRQERLF